MPYFLLRDSKKDKINTYKTFKQKNMVLFIFFMQKNTKEGKYNTKRQRRDITVSVIYRRFGTIKQTYYREYGYAVQQH